MTKNEFLSALGKQLQQRKISDIEDILEEYGDHFAFKIKDGFSEEEIAAKLGDPAAIAAQYEASAEPVKGGVGLKIIAGTGLGFVDIISFPFLLALYAFSVVLVALAIGSLGVAASYVFGLNPYGILPPMPYHCAVIAAITLVALAVLSVLGAYFWTRLVTQMLKSYLRYRKNFMAAATGSAKLLPYPIRMQLAPKVWRRLRRALLISLCVFVFSFVLLFVVCSLSAGAVGWWHAWNWFIS